MINRQTPAELQAEREAQEEADCRDDAAAMKADPNFNKYRSVFSCSERPLLAVHGEWIGFPGYALTPERVE